MDLPPATRLSTPVKKSSPNGQNALSILDEPIDVPEIGKPTSIYLVQRFKTPLGFLLNLVFTFNINNCFILTGLDSDWGEQSIESLPGLSASYSIQNYSNLYGAKSLDNLSSPLHRSTAPTPAPQLDPFDTSPFWPSANATRSNYEITLNEPNISQQTQESHRYASNNHSASTSADVSFYNNAPSTSTAANDNNIYGNLPSTYAMNNALSLERNVVPSVSASLAEMSLDDRISESLNLRSKSNNSDYPYGDPMYSAPSTSTASAQNGTGDNQYNDIPPYKNYDITPAQQQFILETKDYYTKLSTPAKANPRNDYEKNIYVPKYEEEGEKLRNFSDCVENSKNYSAYKYQNVDYSNYGFYGGSIASTSRGEALYDEVNDTASNFYSEIGEPSAQSEDAARNEFATHGAYAVRNPYAEQHVYANANLYDEVYEESVPRPHRPAPPCPQPK